MSNNVCRVCESPDDLEIVSNNVNEGILSMLKDVGRSGIKEDDHICRPCVLTLKDFYQFKSLYKSTYAKFRRPIDQMQRGSSELVVVQISSAADRTNSGEELRTNEELPDFHGSVRSREGSESIVKDTKHHNMEVKEDSSDEDGELELNPKIEHAEEEPQLMDQDRKCGSFDGYAMKRSTAFDFAHKPKRWKFRQDVPNILFSEPFFRVHQPTGSSGSESDSMKLSAQCLLCKNKTTIIKGTSGVSSNFIKHLKIKHPDGLEMYKSRKQFPCPMRKNSAYLKQKMFEKKFMDFIIDTISPLSVVDNKHFKAMFEGTSNNVPSKRTLENNITNYYSNVRNKIKEAISKAEFLCMTADIWCTKSRSFFAYTCHWLGSDFKRHSAALAFKRFTGVHSCDRIAELIFQVHQEFQVPQKKVMATITDNASNFSKAFKDFGISPDFLSENSEGDEEYHCYEIDNVIDAERLNLLYQIQSVSHNLHLVCTTDFLETIKKDEILFDRHSQVFSKCNALWRKSGCPKSAEVIRNILGISLSYPVVTKWNSIADAVMKILSRDYCLGKLCESLKIENFNKNDLLYLKEYVKVMKPFSEAIDFLQKEIGVHYGAVIPTLVTLKVKIERLINDEGDPLSFLKHPMQMILDRLVVRFENYFKLKPSVNMAIVAAVTHPNIKLKWFNVLRSISSRSQDEITEMVVLEASKECNESSTEGESQESGMNSSYQFFDFGEDSQVLGEASVLSKTNQTHVRSQIFRFLNDPSFNTLEKLNELPVVEKLFRRTNTALASSGPVERLFSMGTIFNSPPRWELSDGYFEKLVLLKANKSFWENFWMINASSSIQNL